MRNSMLDRLIEWFVFRAQRRMISWRFKASLGYAGDFENPKSHQEKVQFRKLYGNHAFYALVADKYRVRSYVAAKVGDQHLIPLLGAYERLHKSVFDKLPEQFIIKANHGCKWHQVVYDKRKLDIDKTVRRFNELCKRCFGWISGERHYSFIQPKIVIEQLLRAAGCGRRVAVGLLLLLLSRTRRFRLRFRDSLAGWQERRLRQRLETSP